MSETTETSARLRWERPEPPAPYSYDVTVTSAHDLSPVLKLNLTATELVARGLRAGHTYHVAVVCHLRSQVRATYQGSFSTSEYAVGRARGPVLLPRLRSGAVARLGQNPGRFGCSQFQHGVPRELSPCFWGPRPSVEETRSVWPECSAFPGGRDLPV